MLTSTMVSSRATAPWSRSLLRPARVAAPSGHGKIPSGGGDLSHAGEEIIVGYLQGGAAALPDDLQDQIVADRGLHPEARSYGMRVLPGLGFVGQGPWEEGGFTPQAMGDFSRWRFGGSADPTVSRAR